MGANRQIYEFDDVRVEAGEFRVLKSGNAVSLEPKAFEVLLALISRAGSLVSKDELLDEVWNESFVTPNVLTRAIAQIRRGLGDSRGNPAYIATVPKRGYRFVASLKPDGDELPEDSLAVLPFAYLGADTSKQYLGVGMADSLITKLSNARSLTVRPTASVVRFQDTGNPFLAGKDLNVRYLITGTIQESGGNFRVSVQMVRVSDETPLWGGTFTAGKGEIFDLQDEISSNIAVSLRIGLTEREQRRMLRRQTEDPEAHKLYMRGRYHLYQFTEDSRQRAIRLFTEAVEADPDYAIAHAGLAGAHIFGSQFGDDESAVLAEHSAHRAVELDPALAEGHSILAAVYFWKHFDRIQAELSFRTALELAPNSSEINYFYSWFLAATERFQDAAFHLKRAAEIDPVSSPILVDQGLPLYLSGRFSEARVAYQSALEFAPESWYGLMRLGEAFEAEGRFESSRASLERSAELSGGEPDVLCLLARSLALCGDTTEARRQLAIVSDTGGPYVSPYYLALAHLALGNEGSASTLMETARKRRDKWFAWAGVDPRLKEFRTSRRFRPAV